MASSSSNVYIFIAVWITTVHSFVKLECDETNVGQHGHQSVLTCVIKPGENDEHVKVRAVTWMNMGIKETLLFFHNGKTTSQPGYQFADSSFNESNMNISLLITHTKVTDNGAYECAVITDSGDGEHTTHLRVIARYNTPTISRVNEDDTPNAHSALVCTSKDGYPKGELHWYDDENNIEWTASAQFKVEVMDNGLFQLSSKLPLLPGSTFSKYTCVVLNSSGIKEDEVSFEMPPNFDEHEAPENQNHIQTSKVIAPIVVIGSLIVGLLLALLVYRRRSQITEARRPSTTPLMGQWRGARRSPVNVEEGDTQEGKLN